MSNVLDLAGLAKALYQATTHVGAAPDAWRADSGASRAMQEELLGRLPQLLRDIEKIPELRAWARRTAQEINAILKGEGFEIQLEPWPDADGSFGVVSFLDVTVEWPQPGERTEITVAREGQPRNYPAFLLAKGVVDYLDVGEAKPLLGIPARSDDRVYLHQTLDAPSGLGLYDRVAALRKGRTSSGRFAHFGAATIPQVKLCQQADISWVKSMRIPHPLLLIVQALQEVRFGMNEIGARAKTATALEMSRGGPPPTTEPYIVDGPFLIWIERPELSTPLFVAYVTEEDWKELGSLADI